MATVLVYPAPDQVVEDEAGDTIPSTGKTVTYTPYIAALIRSGRLLTYDPSEEE